MEERAVIIAVGSELLAGQIINRNAAWLSSRLFAHGIDTLRHVTVDDVEGDIVSALDEAAKVASLIFVTGGLGPTSDDLTRQAVARWCGEPLVYHEPSWEHVEAIFARLKVRAPEANRQQCYFPQSAAVLTNRAGTANAFSLAAKGRLVWVLPGPPAEVEAVWTDHIEAGLSQRVPEERRKRLLMWRTIGRGESHLADLLDPMVRGLPGVELAYRAHAPYVELKLRFPVAREEALRPLVQEIEAKLAPWLFETGRQDVTRELAERLKRFASVDIYDGATQGQLMETLGPLFREWGDEAPEISLVTSWERQDSPLTYVQQVLDVPSDAELALVVAGPDASGQWAIGRRRGGASQILEKASPYKGQALRGRNMKAIAALAAKYWLELFAEDLH